MAQHEEPHVCEEPRSYTFANALLCLSLLLFMLHALEKSPNQRNRWTHSEGHLALIYWGATCPANEINNILAAQLKTILLFVQKP